jgi:fructose-1,6-bisphosphatase II
MPGQNVMGVGSVIPVQTAACTVNALGGAESARLAPQSVEERLRIDQAGLDTQRIYTCDDLVAGKEIFFAAAGITDGAVLSGVLNRGRSRISRIAEAELPDRQPVHNSDKAYPV